MEVNPTLRIFLPTAVLEMSSCILVGVKKSSHVCHVTNYIPVINYERLSHVLDDNDIDIVGLYINQLHSVDRERVAECHQLMRQCGDYVSLLRVDSELPVCTLHGSWSNHKPVLVLYDATSLHATCMFSTENPESNMTQLHHSWNKVTQLIHPHLSYFIDTRKTRLHHCSDTIFCMITSFFFFCTSVILKICDSRPIKYYTTNEHLPKPSVILELGHKVRTVHQSLLPCTHSSHTNIHKLRLLNVVWSEVLDVILGLIVMIYAAENAELLARTLMVHTEGVALGLEKLLRWMMGVPAGLKLNQELAQCLGQFFFYHIYLWKGYLVFLVPVWRHGVWCVCMSGCLGVTIQLSLIQDLLSIITLHSYCFYVYAAKLYSLQVYALQSLWRLFRGKKWNPLFERVDSSTYDVDQLFIGTILFTILLFLLPTTALFYTVFTLLRLLVLLIQGGLYQCVHLLHSIHIYAIYLRLLDTSKVTGDVQLSLLRQTTQAPLYHYIQLLPVSWKTLFQKIRISTNPAVDRDTWTSFIHKIFTGKLIYPWIHTENKQNT